MSLDAVVVLLFLEITMDILHRTETAGFNSGPIGLYVDAFKQYLSQRRYAAKTFVTHLRRFLQTL